MGNFFRRIRGVATITAIALLIAIVDVMPLRAIEISGFVDASAVSSNIDNLGSKGNSSLNFDLTVVELDVSHQVGKVAVRADIQTTPTNAGFSLEQGYVSFPLPGIEDATFLFGKFNAPIGFESQDAPDMYQFSNSLVFDILPLNLTGARISFPAGSAQVTAYVVDGVASENDNANDELGFGGRIGFSPREGLSVGVSYVNDDQRDTYDAQSIDYTTYDIDLTYTGFDGWTVGAEYNSSKLETAGTTQKLDGFLAMGNYKLSDVSSLTLRYDQIEANDKGYGTVLVKDEKQKSYTIAYNYSISEQLGAVLEGRKDDSTDKVYVEGQDATKTRDDKTQVSVEFVYSF